MVTAVLLSVAGVIALFGIPGTLSGMELETNALAYVDPDLEVARDTRLFEEEVLGVTENDQIHFFYHFLERRKTGNTEEALAHTIRVAGHAILFATIINAGGFMALALSDLPPMRQFGIITSLAFTLAMLADFTALPAALWIIFKERPSGVSSSR